MKVIQEMIRYLFYKKVINHNDINYLQEKGYYPTFESSKLEYYWDHIDSVILDAEEDESAEFEKITEIEEQLVDKRNRKQGKKGRFIGIKQRHRKNKKQLEIRELKENKQIWWYPDKALIITESIINSLRKTDGLKNQEKLYAIIDEEFEEVNLFWDKIEELIGKEDLIKSRNEIIEALKTSKKGNENSMFIKPDAFHELKNEKGIKNKHGWALKLKLDSKTNISITTETGKINFTKHKN